MSSIEYYWISFAQADKNATWQGKETTMNNIKALDGNPCTLNLCNVEKSCPINNEQNICQYLEKWILDSFNDKPKAYHHSEEARKKMSFARQGKRFPKVMKK